MNTLQGDSRSGQPHKGDLLEQIKNLVTNLLPHHPPFMDKSSLFHLMGMVNKTSGIPHTRATFMAFVDAVIPSTFGALDLRIDDFLIWTLDHNISIQGEWGVRTIPLSAPTAEILDIAATQLILSGALKTYPNFSTSPDGGPFAALSPGDRFEAIHLLETLQVDLQILPPPYRNNMGLVKFMVTNLHQTVMMGYYSEWFSFGSTRLALPEDRFPKNQNMTWNFVSYPGTSMGYRGHRGFLVEHFSD